MIRILNAEPDNFCEPARQILRSLGELTELPCDQLELVRRVGDYDVIIVRLGLRVDRVVLDAGKRLKAVVTATTGLDHVDVEYARSKGVEVLCLRGEVDYLRSIPATAELTWGLLLALTRHIPGAVISVLQGEWDRDQFRGNDLYEKRLGILGLGRIGEKVARYGQVFGMRVAAYDPFRQDWLEGVERCASMADLMAQSDVLSIHVPMNEQTRSLVGRAELERLPRGALLVNTARGGVLDEAALLAALESGHLAGAALDVLANELDAEFRAEDPLLAYARAHENLIITPHIGGATVESMARTEVFMAHKLARFLGKE